MIFGQQKMTSSYSVLCETDTFILIKDNDEPGYSSVTNAAEYTIESLAEAYDLSNHRVIYQDTMQRFDELCHEDGKFTGIRPLTNSQQAFFAELLPGNVQRKE